MPSFYNNFNIFNVIFEKHEIVINWFTDLYRAKNKHKDNIL